MFLVYCNMRRLLVKIAKFYYYRRSKSVIHTYPLRNVVKLLCILTNRHPETWMWLFQLAFQELMVKTYVRSHTGFNKLSRPFQIGDRNILQILNQHLLNSRSAKNAFGTFRIQIHKNIVYNKIILRRSAVMLKSEMGSF
jgi:hypothetical protein